MMKNLVKKKGFLEPTLAQKLSIPIIASNKNALVIAPTGVGKTEAAMLPLLDKVFVHKNKPIALLYITPLRSLNRDLLSRLFWWTDKLGLDIAVRHGDTTQTERAEHRTSPPHILITTPESLGAIITGKKIKQHLKNVKYVVVDEVHELIESKRGVQLSLLLQRLKRMCGSFQIIGLSATIGSPEDAAKFLADNTEIIQAVDEKKVEVYVEAPKKRKVPENLLWPSDVYGRVKRIAELAKQHNSVLVFTNTRSTSEVLATRLKQFEEITGENIGVDVHHGSLSKESRIETEHNFKNGKTKLLVCTSSLELGIDIGSVDLVIQYLSPRQVSRFLQRLGRSGHSIDKTSKGIILTEGEDCFESCVIAHFALKRFLEKPKLLKNSLDVLAHQIVGFAIDEYNITANEVFDLVKKTFLFKDLDKDVFLNVLKFLESLRLIWLVKEANDFIIRRRKKAWMYYFENLSMIPDTRKVVVIDITTKNPIGFLDEEFVAEYSDQGNDFIINGSAWSVIDFDERKLYVEPSKNIESAIPSWAGELIPVPFNVAQEVGRLRRELSTNIGDKGTLASMKRLVKNQKIIPNENTVVVERYKEFIILHCCFGSLVNETIGKYLATAITHEFGHGVQVKIDPYRIILKGITKTDSVVKLLKNAKNVKNTIISGLESSTLFKWKFLHVAKRFGIVSKNAEFDKVSVARLIGLYKGTPVYEETINEILTEKLDIDKTESILNDIKKKKIKIIKSKELTKFGELGLKYQFSDVIMPEHPEEELFKIFKKRLLKSRVKLVCTNCFNYSLTKSIENMKEFEMCPKCGSGLIAIVSKRKMEKEDLVRSASLYITYGKRYAMTMAVHGIGVETAARILAKMPKDEESLLKLILKAEKHFLKTRKYWK